jgi:hypothetical protein
MFWCCCEEPISPLECVGNTAEYFDSLPEIFNPDNLDHPKWEWAFNGTYDPSLANILAQNGELLIGNKYSIGFGDTLNHCISYAHSDMAIGYQWQMEVTIKGIRDDAGRPWNDPTYGFYASFPAVSAATFCYLQFDGGVTYGIQKYVDPTNWTLSKWYLIVPGEDRGDNGLWSYNNDLTIQATYTCVGYDVSSGWEFNVETSFNGVALTPRTSYRQVFTGDTLYDSITMFGSLEARYYYETNWNTRWVTDAWWRLDNFIYAVSA